jgi:hypothetical protein
MLARMKLKGIDRGGAQALEWGRGQQSTAVRPIDGAYVRPPRMAHDATSSHTLLAFSSKKVMHDFHYAKTNETALIYARTTCPF